MKLLRHALPAAVALLLLPVVAAALPVASYTPVFRHAADSSGTPRIVIRTFLSGGIRHVVAADPFTFRTSVEEERNLRFDVPPTPPSSPYLRALERYNTPSERIQNEGVRRAEGDVRGVFLTVDMCPSGREMEKIFFEAVAVGGARPVPLGVAVTGAWMDRHPEEMEHLLRMHAERRLEITWVNHSDTHPYAPGVPFERNFLLSEGVDFRREVLETERKLLEKGGVPSLFFRYPGLISNASLSAELRRLSLVPLGSEAWLAKGETPHDGSIVLVHGNGNEPKGIVRFLELLSNRGEMRFLPLSGLFKAQAKGGPPGRVLP